MGRKGKMEAVLSVLNQAFQDFGATIVLPIVLFAISVAMGAKPGRAFRAALLFGVAFTGLNVVLTMMVESVGPAVAMMVEESGLNLPVMDLSWVAGAGIAWSSKLGILIIPLCVVLDLILIKAGLVRILSVDVWNMWHYAWTGALTYMITGNLVMGFAAASLVMIINTIMADSLAEVFSSYYKVPGVVGYTAESINVRFTAVLIRPLFEKLGLLKWNVSAEQIKARIPLMQPEVVGLFLGIAIGILGHLKSLNSMASWVAIAQLGMVLATAMVLLPITSKMLMEGLIPIVDILKKRARKAGITDMYIGVDDIMVMGEANTISVILLMQPIAVLLMLVVPWNRVMLVDLIDMGLVTGLGAVCIFGGNIVASVIFGAIITIAGFALFNLTTPAFTQIVQQTAFAELPAGVGANNATYFWTWTNYLVYNFFSTIIGPVVVLAAALGFAYWVKNNRARWLKFVGYVAPAETEVEGAIPSLAE